MTSNKFLTTGWRTPVSLAAAMVACMAVQSTAYAALPSFTCERLQDHGSWPFSFSGDINNRGDITGLGTFKSGASSTGGVVWKRDGRIVPLSRTDTGDFNSAGLNDAGQIAGYRYVSGAPTQAFIWSAGVMTRLDSLLGAEGSAEAYDINAVGQVVGVSTWQPGNWMEHAVRWQDGHPVDLGTLPGDQTSAATRINDDGVAVGYSRITSDGPTRAVQWGSAGIVELPALPGYPRTLAVGINRQGVVIGYGTSTAKFAPRPMAWVDGVAQDLGMLQGYTEATPAGINAAGKVVGHSSKDFGSPRATYWPRVGRAPVDLNSLVPGGCQVNGAAWPLSYATGINDKGVVAAYGQVDTDLGPKFVAFRLTPK